MRSMKLFGACLALFAIVGCSPKPAAESTAPAVAAAQPKPVASVLDLMLGQIDPAADFLWESVATISTDKGIEERQPRTDAEWAEVRHKALAVIEGANLLMLEGRRVAGRRGCRSGDLPRLFRGDARRGRTAARGDREARHRGHAGERRRSR
jgi:hypothetical protein